MDRWIWYGTIPLQMLREKGGKHFTNKNGIPWTIISCFTIRFNYTNQHNIPSMRPQKLQPPIPPDELNHHTGFTGTIVGRINKFCKHEDVQNGIDQKAQARKRKETSDSQIEGHKNRITVGLLASAQTLPLDQIFLLLHWNGSEFFSDIVISKKETKRQQEFNTLCLHWRNRTKQKNERLWQNWNQWCIGTNYQVICWFHKQEGKL